MAVAVHERSRGSVRGLVVTRYGHGLLPGESSGRIEILESSHPLPDEASAEAGQRLLDFAEALGPTDTLLFLVSGGGSALTIAPLGAVTLEQKRSASDFLMRAGADIRDINCVRRHLSALKGGRLARAAHPARVITLAISDVPGDAIGDIASGPTIPDMTTAAQALEILTRHGYPDRDELAAVLAEPRFESPDGGDAEFASDSAQIIASSKTSLDAAQVRLEAAGYDVRRLGDHLTDVARDLGREHAVLARELAAGKAPVALLSGGETRVVVRGKNGRGGRNLEYLAGLALELDGHENIIALAADTDGIDGSADHAGGIVTPGTLALGREAGVDLAALLEQNDTYRYFQACKLLVVTGPTRTNVNDFRLILINPLVLESYGD
jgi:hydroxypyruvate reductase